LKAYVTKLTLKEELINGKNIKIPRQVYFIEGSECLENIDLLDGLKAFCKCDDGEDYYGTIEYDGDFGLKLNLDKSKHNYEDDYVRVVLDDPEVIENYKNITKVFHQIDMINGFRFAGPWIAVKDTSEFTSQYEYIKPTSDVSCETFKPTLVEKGSSTDVKKLEDKEIDAVNQPKGLRLDNLEFGIVDGSGRRLRVMVRNEEDESANDSYVETVEFYKSSNLGAKGKSLGVSVGT
jgi:hypothetical protein